MNERLAAQIEQLEALVEAGNFSDALDFLESLSQEERGQWQIQNLTGIVCACCGRPQEAETFFTAALEQMPEDLDIMYNLADTYVMQKKDRQAEEMISRCEAQDKDGALEDALAQLRECLTKQKPKKVLMVAYYFPPLSGSGVFRSIKFAKYLPLYGWRPTVISTDQPPNGWNFADETQVTEIPAEAEVIRIPDKISTGRETTIGSNRMQSVLGFLQSVLQFSLEADTIFSKMVQEQQGLIQLFTFPCAVLSWAYDVAQYIEKHMDLNQFDVIYTTSGPSSAHLIGFYLKQKYGIPWVADYRDPWTFNPYGPSYDASNPGQKLLFELESVLLRHASCNITVSDGWAQDYIKHFQIPRDQIVSITNGYDEADFSLLGAPGGRTKKFTISYCGLLYTAQRSIEPIFIALSKLAKERKIDLKQVEFRVVGNSSQDNIQVAQKYKLGSILVQTGYLSHIDALKSNLDANILLLLVGDDPKFSAVYTGKIFEYLRSGKPILALAPKGGIVDQVLQETGHGKSFLSSQISKIKEMLLQEYQKWQSGETAGPLCSPQIAQFERKTLTQELARVLETVRNPSASSVLEIRSEVYDALYQCGGAGGSYHKHYTQSINYSEWKEVMSFLYLLDRSTKILEIGCGPGQFANMLFDYGFLNYIGFDYSTEGIALAKKSNPNHAEQFFVADGFQTDLMLEEYDLVICFEVLEHIQRDLELLQRIRSGTKMLLSVPNFDDPNHVRFFHSAEEVRARYQNVMRIFNIHISKLEGSPNCLYYIVGEKL